MKTRRTVGVTLSSILVAAGCASTYSNLGPDQRLLLEPASLEIAEQPDAADIAVQRVREMSVTATCAYDVLADINQWTSWDSNIREARLIEGERAREGAMFFQDFGDFQAHARILVADRGRRLRWRGQAPDGSGPVGVHTWTFLPLDDGSTLVLNDEHFHKWYLRLLGWFTDFGVAEQFDASLADLEKKAKRRCGRGA